MACAAYAGLTTSYLTLKDYDSARHASREVQELSRNINYEIVQGHSWWLNGLVKKATGEEKKAGYYLSKSIRSFCKLRQPQYVCGILLELAMIYAESGRTLDTLAAVSDAMEILKLLRVEKEALAAVRLLRDAIVRQNVTGEILKEAGGLVENLLQHPLTGIRLRMKEKAGEIPALQITLP